MISQSGISSFFLLIVVLALGIIPGWLPAEDLIHVVARGETLYSISRTHGISSEELMRYNNITDVSRLQVGSRLRIPATPSVRPAGTQAASGTSAVQTPAAVAANAPYTEYRVVRDDTLYSIARAHGLTLPALQEFNGFPGNYVLKAGELIKIPNVAGSVRTVTTSVTTSVTASQAVSNGSLSSLRWPVNPQEIAYMNGKPYCMVLSAERAEPVKSLTRGTVIWAGPYRGYGRMAIVRTADGYDYVYGGCESLSVQLGDQIGPGMELGKLGIVTDSGKAQLVFMVYRNNFPIDPAKAPRA
ncbi:MAG: M23 family metallopeptidase [Treponema sp.]|jgi:LysM repeat protein|nr:M23 family metallopeptidase [Treponema sp.]